MVNLVGMWVIYSVCGFSDLCLGLKKQKKRKPERGSIPIPGAPALSRPRKEHLQLGTPRAPHSCPISGAGSAYVRRIEALTSEICVPAASSGAWPSPLPPPSPGSWVLVNTHPGSPPASWDWCPNGPRRQVPIRDGQMGSGCPGGRPELHRRRGGHLPPPPRAGQPPHGVRWGSWAGGRPVEGPLHPLDVSQGLHPQGPHSRGSPSRPDGLSSGPPRSPWLLCQGSPTCVYAPEGSPGCEQRGTHGRCRGARPGS